MDKPLMRWFTDGTEQPVEVELLEIFADIECTVREGGDTFQADQDYLFHEWADAWRFYLSFMGRVRDLIGSFDYGMSLEEFEEYVQGEFVIAHSKLDKGR